MKKKIKAEEYMNWDKNLTKELSSLEHLEFIRNYEIDDEHRTLNMNYATKQSLDIIELALKEHELMKEIRITARFDLAQVNKEHKALEIIKTHPEQLLDIIETDNYKEYLDLDYAPDQYLSEEKYYLLKEILK